MIVLIVLYVSFLMETQNAAGCRQRGGRCTYGRCNFPERPIGRCTLYSVCYPEIGKQHMALTSGSWTHILMSPCPDVPCPGCLCRAQLG
uniref:Beta-defensin-like domain-containing protein n=1 Tax=Cyanoderma ruficeps TaxID=181631 RepID=A0A8C3R0W9_9PASS